MPSRALADTRRTALVVPGRIDTRTGGYGYDRRIVAGLADRGWQVPVYQLDDSFPWPTGVALRQAEDVLAAIPDGTPVLIDGLAYGAMPALVHEAARRLRLVALVHHPLALETGLSVAQAAALEASERAALEAAHLVVVTSRPTATVLAPYGVEVDRIVVVEPGTDPAPPARGSGGPTVVLLCVASVVPRKGHEVLVSALAPLTHLDWRMTCAGGLDRDADTAARLQAQVDAAGLSSRVTFVGEAGGADLDALYDRADVFVLPTLYEGYGMVVAEAVARGLPVVSTPTGAIADLVPPHAGLLVPIGDAHALSAALATMIGSPEQRAGFARGALRARQRLRTWAHAAAAMENALLQSMADGVQR